MNDFELESKLKSVRVPERSEDYWENFPSQVRVNLRRFPVECAPRNTFWPGLAWAGGFALALILVCIEFHPVKTVSAAIENKRQHLSAQIARLDAGLHVLMLDQHGMSYLVAEKN